MTKDDVLMAFYKQQISALVEQCNDLEMLDFITRLLEKLKKKNKGR